MSEIAKEKAATTAVTENSPAGQPAFVRSLTGLVTSAGDAFNEAARLSSEISNSVNSLTGPAGRALSAASGAVTNAAGAVTNAAGAVTNAASTVNSLTGRVNNLTTAINSVTGNSGTALIQGGSGGDAVSGDAGNDTINNVTTSLSTLAEGVTDLTRLPNTINTGTINNALVNSTEQLATAAGSVTTAINSLANAGNNLESTAQQVTTLIDSTTGNGVDNLANSISGAVDNINSLAGGATSLKNGLSGLANAAKKAQGGGLAARASALASGVSNLPGGINAFSSVLDKAEDAINQVPGTGQLTGLMNDLQTGVKNGLGNVTSTLTSVSNAAGAATSALNTANNLVGAAGATTAALGNLSSIASTAGGLTSAIASKLPIGQVTQLLSSVSALGAGGASPIRLPSLGVNTTNRDGITAQIRGVLGDARIPIPNLLGDIVGDAITSIENRIARLRAERKRIQEQIDVAKEEETAAGNAFIQAFNTLPAGDPSLAALEKKFNDATAKVASLRQELANVGKRPRKAAPATDPAAPGAPAAGTGTTT